MQLFQSCDHPIVSFVQTPDGGRGGGEAEGHSGDGRQRQQELSRGLWWWVVLVFVVVVVVMVVVMSSSEFDNLDR